jgi:glycerophosphoryl diester phosphodiesterase
MQVIAHRGASRADVENTLEAFRTAGRMGADAVELDVRRTADGALVIHHNPDLGDGRLIAAIGRDQLPDHVPTLRAALDACAGMWVNVEIKNDPNEADFDATDAVADQTIAELQSRCDDDRWVISSFRLETIDRCRALAPSIRTAWLTVENPPDIVEVLTSRGHLAWHPWVRLLEQRHVDACHEAGLQVNTWTCDDPQRMAELIGWGIDGICTNVPDVCLQVRGG